MGFFIKEIIQGQWGYTIGSALGLISGFLIGVLWEEWRLLEEKK